MLFLSNTLTRKKESFHKINDSIKMYVCGITPYSPAHIGHGRCYISFDILYRLLQFLGYQVIYCRNITDIDDKLLERASTLLGNPLKYQEIAMTYFDQFKKSLYALNCLDPLYEPRVTDHIPEIITFIEELITKGNAYVSENDVYFDISTASDYGKLSGQKINELKKGLRVAVRSKKDPLDFVLWKGEKDQTFWPSPWGNGRPGWHIECSALARRYLGEHLDIHAGGLDLIFPHHENEICQSEALFGEPFAHIWLHNGLVTVNHEKMSKSLGNFIVLDDLIAQYEASFVRYFFALHHYKSPLEFNKEVIESTYKTYERLADFFDSLIPEKIEEKKIKEFPILLKMHECLCDDLNTPALFGVLFSNLSILAHDIEQKKAIFNYLIYVLGLSFIKKEEQKQINSPEIEQLIEEREKAREQKDWAKADQLRDKLMQLGYHIADKKMKK
jgi:cysteinyl-tRNA synthetase